VTYYFIGAVTGGTVRVRCIRVVAPGDPELLRKRLEDAARRVVEGGAYAPRITHIGDRVVDTLPDLEPGTHIDVTGLSLPAPLVVLRVETP
jgi:hypothetical protein